MTIAIDNPKLRAIRSILSMPRVVFFVGNKTKISRYPGINSIKGSPRIILTASLRLNRITGTISKLQRIQAKTSIGYR